MWSSNTSNKSTINVKSILHTKSTVSKSTPPAVQKGGQKKFVVSSLTGQSNFSQLEFNPWTVSISDYGTFSQLRKWVTVYFIITGWPLQRILVFEETTNQFSEGESFYRLVWAPEQFSWEHNFLVEYYFLVECWQNVFTSRGRSAHLLRHVWVCIHT